MLSRLFRHIFSSGTDPDLTTADWDNMDVAREDVLTLQDCEKVMVEDGEVVGTTAVLGDQTVVPTRGRHPAM